MVESLQPPTVHVPLGPIKCPPNFVPWFQRRHQQFGHCFEALSFRVDFGIVTLDMLDPSDENSKEASGNYTDNSHRWLQFFENPLEMS